MRGNVSTKIRKKEGNQNGADHEQHIGHQRRFDWAEIPKNSVFVRKRFCSRGMFCLCCFVIQIETALYIFVQFISSIGSVSGEPKAPNLNVSQVSNSTAKIKFESDHLKSAVLYSLRYRKESGNDEDEKESEWREQVVDANTDEYTLSGLAPGTAYGVMGRYKMLENMVWSRYSKIVNVTTDKWDAFWDPSRKHDDLVLSDNNKKMKNAKSGWHAVAMKQELTAEMGVVSIEFVLGDIDGAVNSLEIGFVDSSSISQFRTGTWIGKRDRPKEWCLQIDNNQFVTLQNGITKKTFDSKFQGKYCKNEDRLLLNFDFPQSKCTVQFNDEDVGVLSKELPKRVFVLGCAYYSVYSLTITKFEVSSKM